MRNDSYRERVLAYFQPFRTWMAGQLEGGAYEREREQASRIRFQIEDQQSVDSKFKTLRINCYRSDGTAADCGFAFYVDSMTAPILDDRCLVTSRVHDFTDPGNLHVRVMFDCINGPDGPHFWPVCKLASCDYALCPFSIAFYEVLEHVASGLVDSAAFSFFIFPCLRTRTKIYAEDLLDEERGIARNAPGSESAAAFDPVGLDGGMQDASGLQKGQAASSAEAPVAADGANTDAERQEAMSKRADAFIEEARKHLRMSEGAEVLRLLFSPKEHDFNACIVCDDPDRSRRLAGRIHSILKDLDKIFPDEDNNNSDLTQMTLAELSGLYDYKTDQFVPRRGARYLSSSEHLQPWKLYLLNGVGAFASLWNESSPNKNSDLEARRQQEAVIRELSSNTKNVYFVVLATSREYDQLMALDRSLSFTLGGADHPPCRHG